MAYYYSCNECNTTSLFDNGSITNIDPIVDYLILRNIRGGSISLDQNESVICSSCVSTKTRLKGNYIIIEKGNK
jgi:hypothetical protein